MTSDNKKKGDLLEDVVALLHKVPAAKIEKRVAVPVPGSDRTREIDVLITQYVVGYPVRIAIECKNEKEPIEIDYIDSFVGKLQEVGIPVVQGIYVSPVGFTSGARARAAASGIRLLVLDGLTEDRMAALVSQTLLQVVHSVLYVESMTIFPYLPFSADGEPWPKGIEIEPHSLHDAIWERWLTGRLPTTLGEQMVFFRSDPGGAAVSCRIVAYAGRVPGTSSLFSLKNAASGAVERAHLEAQFQMPSTVDLEVFKSDADLLALQTALAKESHVVVQHIRVPRIVAGPIYWPPSPEAVTRLMRLRQSGASVSFAMVEGRDLSRAWEVTERERARSESRKR